MGEIESPKLFNRTERAESSKATLAHFAHLEWNTAPDIFFETFDLAPQTKTTIYDEQLDTNGKTNVQHSTVFWTLYYSSLVRLPQTPPHPISAQYSSTVRVDSRETTQSRDRRAPSVMCVAVISFIKPLPEVEHMFLANKSKQVKPGRSGGSRQCKPTPSIEPPSTEPGMPCGG